MGRSTLYRACSDTAIGERELTAMSHVELTPRRKFQARARACFIISQLFGSWQRLYLIVLRIRPSGRGLSLASFEARARNSAWVRGACGSSLPGNALPEVERRSVRTAADGRCSVTK